MGRQREFSHLRWGGPEVDTLLADGIVEAKSWHYRWDSCRLVQHLMYILLRI